MNSAAPSYALPPPSASLRGPHSSSNMSQLPAGYSHAPPPSAHPQHHQHPPAGSQGMSQHGYVPSQQHHQGHHAPPPPSAHPHQYQPVTHSQHQQPHAPPPPSMLHASHSAQVPSQTQVSRRDDPSSQRVAPENVLIPLSFVDESTNRRFSLDVAQQPLRARMCGFGDKDRRPITPPPCVRLVITDLTTGREIDPNEVEHGLFVLNVDLWSEDGTREVNLVKSSTGSPSISSTTPYSYSTLNGGGDVAQPQQQQYGGQMVSARGDQTAYAQSPGVGYVNDYQVQQGYAPVPPNYAPQGQYGPPQQYYPQQGYRPEAGVPSLPSQAMSGYGRNGMPGFGPDQNMMTRAVGQAGDSRGGMFTRNLIGQLAASAFKLHDTGDRLGIWFILQDLSVRTEGCFRLRFSFVNVGAPGGVRSQEDGAPKLNTGRAPILAAGFSEVFQVYSAKKFPGVCESTALSKTFATQGIKIPIRKDTKNGGGDDDDYD